MVFSTNVFFFLNLYNKTEFLLIIDVKLLPFSFSASKLIRSIIADFIIEVRWHFWAANCATDFNITRLLAKIIRIFYSGDSAFYTSRAYNHYQKSKSYFLCDAQLMSTNRNGTKQSSFIVCEIIRRFRD